MGRLAAASTWFTNQLINGAAMQSNLIDPINAIDDQAIKYLTDLTANDSSTITLASLGGNYAPANTYEVVTIQQQRRLRIDVMTRVQQASGSVSGLFQSRAAYNVGSALDSSNIQLLNPVFVTPSIGDTRPFSVGPAWGIVVLPAGTYRFYPIVTRVSGGAAGDAINGQCSVVVTDLGAS